MKQLNKLTGETIAQSIAEPAISDNFTSSFKEQLKKVGSPFMIAMVVLGITSISPEVHAMDYKSFAITSGLGTVAGMANDGKVPKNFPAACANIKGVSGSQDAAATATGALLGANIGNGTGQKVATGGLGLLSYLFSNGSQQQRMSKECEAILIQQQQQEQQFQQQQQQQFRNNGPTADILYQAQTQDGQSIFVTMENSPGLLAITGNRQGIIDPLTSPVVYNGVKDSLDLLNASYVNLNAISKKYLSVINGSEEEIFNPRPETNPRKEKLIAQLAEDYKKAYDVYASKRGIAAHILDEASARNYNLNEFSSAVSLFQVPQSAKVTYPSVYHKGFENRYANDIKLGSGVR